MTDTQTCIVLSPWFPYRLTGAIIGALGGMLREPPWFPYRLTGAIIHATHDILGIAAVVPLQTHGCYNLVNSILALRYCRGSPTDSRVL